MSGVGNVRAQVAPCGKPVRLQLGTSSTALLVRCRNGDSAAWEELVGRYERLVYGVAVREGLTAEDAADVTQTVFEALISSMDKIRQLDSLAAWLVSVARRHSWRVRSRHLKEHPVPEIDDGVGWRSLAGSDEQATDGVERAIVVYEALLELNSGCRELLVALYFDPKAPSYEEIALRLRRPVGSIGPTRARCLEHLRRVLPAEVNQ
jgi:RNA polymerase sigma factor (sigma-70 family)